MSGALRLLVAALLMAACAAPGTRSGTGLNAGFPPSDEETLIRHLQPLVQPFGLDMTRASLIDLDANYSPSPTGRHLAMYARPPGTYPVERYVGNLAPLTAALTEVFARWSQLESFDICQEPFDDPAEAPQPVTRVNVPRADGAAVAAAGSDLAALLTIARERNAGADPRGLVVEVFGPAQDHPIYRQALGNADSTG